MYKIIPAKMRKATPPATPPAIAAMLVDFGAGPSIIGNGSGVPDISLPGVTFADDGKGDCEFDGWEKGKFEDDERAAED